MRKLRAIHARAARFCASQRSWPHELAQQIACCGRRGAVADLRHRRDLEQTPIAFNFCRAAAAGSRARSLGHRVGAAQDSAELFGNTRARRASRVHGSENDHPETDRSAHRADGVASMSELLKFNDARGTRSGAFSFDHYRGRMTVVLIVLLFAIAGLLARAVQLQLVSQRFYEDQGKARYTRVAKLAAHRGAILDRNCEPLAVSTPVDTVWVNPQELQNASDQYRRLAEALNRDVNWLTQKVSSNLDREFLYLVRGMRPDDAAQVKAL